MIRLHVTVEGPTEQRFLKDVLGPHLAEHSVYVDGRPVLTSKDKRAGVEYRGGFRRTGVYETARKDICAWMKADRNADAWFTTMSILVFNFYPVTAVSWRPAMGRQLSRIFYKVSIRWNSLPSLWGVYPIGKTAHRVA
jgi:hypothetical protein